MTSLRPPTPAHFPISSLSSHDVEKADDPNLDNPSIDDPSLDDPNLDDQDTDDVLDDGSLDFLELNAQLRLELGRRLTIALLDQPGGGGPAFDALLAALAGYPEVRILVVRSEDAHDAAALEAAIAEVLREGADSLLVWTDDRMGDKGPAEKDDRACSQGEQWARLMASVADRLNLYERCFIALIGEGVTRAGARRLGFDDGFVSEAPVSDLMQALVREMLTREVYRRRDSSPPCLL